jgi:hypothetical protein
LKEWWPKLNKKQKEIKCWGKKKVNQEKNKKNSNQKNEDQNWIKKNKCNEMVMDKIKKRRRKNI